jgi:hypothetical protein
MRTALLALIVACTTATSQPTLDAPAADLVLCAPESRFCAVGGSDSGICVATPGVEGVCHAACVSGQCSSGSPAMTTSGDCFCR